MNTMLQVSVYLFPLTLLGIIFVKMYQNPVQTTDIRLFKNMLLVTFILLFLDLVSRVLELCSIPYLREILWGMNYLYFWLTPLVSFLWLNYIHFHLNNQTLVREKGKKSILIMIPLVVFCGAMIVQLFYPCIFSITYQKQYARGPLFWFPYLIVFFYMGASWVYLFSSSLEEKMNLTKRSHLVLSFYTMLPIVAGILQMFSASFILVLPITAISEILFYTQLQNQQITKDALTGINNRGALDTYLTNQMEHFSAENPYYLFMIDLNRFKQINDTYGHVVGDEALKEAANILKKQLHSSSAFLARYGGDEFCIIEQCNNEEDASVLLEGWEQAFIQSNKNANRSYELTASIGFAKMDENSVMSMKTIVEKADKMMYERKRRRA